MSVLETLTMPLWFLQSLTQTIWTIVILMFLTLIYKAYIVPYRLLRKAGLKIPTPKPFYGNVLDYGSNNEHIAQVKRQEIYGGVYGTLSLHIPTVWIADPEILKTVMVRDFDNFTNRYPFIKPMRPFDKSLLELKDKDWKRVRSIVVPTFSASKLKTIMPFITKASDNLIKQLLKAEEENKAIDIWKTCGDFTMSVILATALGVEVESEGPESKLTRASRKMFEKRTDFGQLLLILLPSLYILLEPLVGNIMNSIKYVTKTAEISIKERRKNLVQGIPCRNDILQQLIKAGDEDKLSDEEIISQAFVFLIAGYETTANTLAYTSYLLATNPHAQRKLIDEIDLKCPDESCVDYHTINDLPYLNMIISETLRMYPPVFMMNREIKQDTTINGIHISKDVMIGLPIYGVHHNPKLWPNPEQFIPERFTTEEKAKRHPYSYLPFGGGPRSCVGMRLALLEAKMALVAMLQRVELITMKETEIPLQLESGDTLAPANGVYLGIRKRH